MTETGNNEVRQRLNFLKSLQALTNKIHATSNADEIMLELVTSLGLTAAEVFDSWLEFMSMTEKVAPRRDGELDATQCKALLDADFTETDGEGRRRAALVPLGSLSDPHHSSCYRLFNLWHEQRRHGYVPTKAFTPPPGAAWGDLRAIASALTQGANPRTH